MSEVKVTYGVKNFQIVDGLETFNSIPEIQSLSYDPVKDGQSWSTELKLSIDVKDIDSKLMEALFGKGYQYKPKDRSRIYPIKIKNKAYARPTYVYQPFARPVSTKAIPITKKLIEWSWKRKRL
jgi:hypothetical protein